MVFADVYPQPDAPDPVLDEYIVVNAARRHIPDAGPLLSVDESGGEARAYLLDGDVVMKTQRPHRQRPRTSLAKEAFFLGELHCQGDFPVPQVLGHGQMGSTEYLCLTRLTGSSLLHADLKPDDRRSCLTQLGRTLRAIHDIDQTALENGTMLPGDRSPADLRIRIATTFARLAAAFDSDRRLGTVVDVRRIAVMRLDVTPDNTPPVSLHSNPGLEHIFVDATTSTFTGLIDFGDAYRSHPAFDFRQWSDDGDTDAVLDGYRTIGPLPLHFEDVRSTVVIIEALSRAARGKSTGDELAATLDRIANRERAGLL